MASLILAIGGAVLALAFFQIITRSQKIKEQELFRELNIAIKKQDGELENPKFKLKKNKLILNRYSPTTTKNFTEDALIAISKVFIKNEHDHFVIAEYEKSNFFERAFLNYNRNKLVLYNSEIATTDFYKDQPDLKKYHFWVGKDVKNEDLIFSVKNKTTILITGRTGLAKTSLANVILTSLFFSKSVKDEFIFTKLKSDYLSGPNTTFIHKDDEQKMLEVLRQLKSEAIRKQKELDNKRRQSVFEDNESLRIILFDECHTYLAMTNNLTKEEKAIRAEIIEIAKFFLNQARAVGYVVIFILPSADAESVDLNLRESHFTFCASIPSATVSKNLLGSPIAGLIPPKAGLFAVKHNNKVNLFQTSRISQDKK